MRTKLASVTFYGKITCDIIVAIPMQLISICDVRIESVWLILRLVMAYPHTKYIVPKEIKFQKQAMLVTHLIFLYVDYNHSYNHGYNYCCNYCCNYAYKVYHKYIPHSASVTDCCGALFCCFFLRLFSLPLRLQVIYTLGISSSKMALLKFRR